CARADYGNFDHW
nr:immunoglobulin heavy chain junction region [Macaca mulatta]